MKLLQHFMKSKVIVPAFVILISGCSNSSGNQPISVNRESVKSCSKSYKSILPNGTKSIDSSSYRKLSADELNSIPVLPIGWNFSTAYNIHQEEFTSMSNGNWGYGGHIAIFFDKSGNKYITITDKESLHRVGYIKLAGVADDGLWPLQAAEADRE